MSSLAETHQKFLKRFQQGNEDFLSNVRENGFNPIDRYQIYEKNILSNLSRALSLTFPNVWKLIGDKAANRAACDYCRQNLPINGFLGEWGESFPDYLTGDPWCKDLPYLQDVAYLDWLKHLACMAPEVEENSLTIPSEDSLLRARVVFNPSLNFFCSKYPIEDILRSLTDPEGASVKLGGSQGIVFRENGIVQVFWLREDIYDFLEGLLYKPVGVAIWEITPDYPNFNHDEVLSFALQYQLIETFQV